MNKEIEKKLTVEDLVKLRNEAVSLENEIVEKLKRFNEIGNKVGGYFCSDFLRDISAYNPKIENYNKIENSFWKYFVEKSGLMQLMTEKKKSEVMDNLREHPEPFTEKYVTRMVGNLNNLYMENGSLLIKEVYQSMIGCRYYGSSYTPKRDNLQKVNKLFRCYGSLRYDCNGRISQDSYRCHGVNFEDVYRVFYLLDGKMNSDYCYNFNAIVNDQTTENPSTQTIETEYFSVRHYQNGNNKVTIKRLDLLSLLNKVGSGYSSLPDVMSKRYKKGDL